MTIFGRGMQSVKECDREGGVIFGRKVRDLICERPLTCNSYYISYCILCFKFMFYTRLYLFICLECSSQTTSKTSDRWSVKK